MTTTPKQSPKARKAQSPKGHNDMNLDDDTHDLALFPTVDDIIRYILLKKMCGTVTVLLTQCSPDDIAAFKFPGPLDQRGVKGPRTQTLDPDQVAGLLATLRHQGTIEAKQTALALQAPVASFQQPGQGPPPQGAETQDDTDECYAAFLEGCALLKHAEGFVGGAKTQAWRDNMMVKDGTQWCATFRDYKKLRVVVLGKMSKDFRSFLVGPPVDVRELPVYAQKAIVDRFEVDFTEIRLLFLQAYIMAKKKVFRSQESILQSWKDGIDCLSTQAPKKRERTE